jgi:hypothetical protein
MRAFKAIVLVVVGLAALSHRSDGQQRVPLEQQFKLARTMPKGALLYVQARDLSSLAGRWMASPARAQFYKSHSFTAFSRSRIYLKLQSRIKDFERAIGVGLNEERLAELSGGASAVAVYGIGDTELMFATELARPRFLTTALFQQAPRLQERRAEGTVYYAADVTTDGGHLKQQFCFAHTRGLLLVTTTEALMLRALRNMAAAGVQSPPADSLLPDLLARASQIEGFATHDLTMWIDQQRLNGNRYFTSNWIHKNGETLSIIRDGMIDLRISSSGISEQRWFAMGTEQAGAEFETQRAQQLMKYAPATAQLVKLSSVDSGQSGIGQLARKVAGMLLSKAPTAGEGVGAPPSEADSEEVSSDSHGGSGRVEGYARLDSRFDLDVDDEPSRLGGDSRIASDADLATSITPIFEAVSPGGYCEIARAGLDSRQLFVDFERGIVIEMRPGTSIDRAALEATIIKALGARFVLAGVAAQLEWRDEGSIRYLAQSLLQRGVAYAVSDRYLVMASSKQLVADSIRSVASPAAPGPAVTPGGVDSYAVVRIDRAKAAFDKIVSTLDRKSVQPASEGGDDHEIKFFSENISSLIDALSIKEMRISRASRRGALVERVEYLWR